MNFKLRKLGLVISADKLTCKHFFLRLFLKEKWGKEKLRKSRGKEMRKLVLNCTITYFQMPYKISMVNHTFYKYSLSLLYNIHTLLFYILNKNLSLYKYHISEFEQKLFPYPFSHAGV
ncbi:hypothetical protein BpHYR1_040909 [Brachionus plicatilis]|uniref:Uncharacterized protein n=1 Tax=Brachionus plicatilis TaxID=10195 RepID=A0A3M7QJ52_BRAPC|nr:hypothetical protein BpHYR1_040909 [Brachionus plicatilis]